MEGEWAFPLLLEADGKDPCPLYDRADAPRARSLPPHPFGDRDAPLEGADPAARASPRQGQRPSVLHDAIRAVGTPLRLRRLRPSTRTSPERTRALKPDVRPASIAASVCLPPLRIRRKTSPRCRVRIARPSGSESQARPTGPAVRAPRREAHHWLTRQLVDTYGEVVMEDLAIAALKRSVVGAPFDARCRTLDSGPSASCWHTRPTGKACA